MLGVWIMVAVMPVIDPPMMKAATMVWTDLNVEVTSGQARSNTTPVLGPE
jgi:hypothetical protein